MKLTKDHLKEEIPENTSIILCDKDASNDLLVVINKGKVKPEECKAWTRTILSRINSQEVLVFEEVRISKYYHSLMKEKPYPPFLRKIQTDRAREESKKDDILFYEAPNVIDTLSAAIISYCQIHCKRAIVYVSLAENVIDDNVLLAYESVLKEIGHLSSESSLKTLRKAYSQTLKVAPKRSLFI